MLITTTNSLEDVIIEDYIELISTNVVVGTNFFSDLAASYSDFFGGHSETYQKKLDGIYKVALNNLKNKAQNLNANAIIGLAVNFDEISGKGKTMFMISAIGTAVRIKRTNKKTNIKRNIISSDILQLEITKLTIIKKLSEGKLPSKEEWIFLLEYPIEEISTQLLQAYFVSAKKHNIESSDDEILLKSYINNYFAKLPEELSLQILYSNIKEQPGVVLEIIKSGSLFSPNKVLELLTAGETSLGVSCLPFEKKYYTANDLIVMNEIIAKLSNLDNVGKIEAVKKVIGKGSNKYICKYGHINDLELEYCKDCGINIKGLKNEGVNVIKKFNIKVEALSKVLTET